MLVKTIPDLAQARVSRSQGRLVTEAPPILNPIDLEAVECAVRLRAERSGSEVVTITLGEPSVEGSLKKLAALGADQCYLVDQTGIAMEDPACRARVLAAAVQKLGGVDHVLAGSGSVTGGGGAVAYAMAEALRCAARPMISALSDLPPPPSVATVAPGQFPPRSTPITAIARAAKVPLTRWTLADLGLTAGAVGAEAAAVQVRRRYLPDPETAPGRMAASSGEGELPPTDWSGLLVVGESAGARLAPGTAGTVALAAEVAQLLGARVTVLLVGAEAAARAIRYGADLVRTCASEDRLLEAVTALVAADHPEAVLWDDTPAARVMAARLSLRLQTGYLLGASYVALDAEHRQLVVTQLIYEGRLMQEGVIRTRPQLITLATAGQATPVPDAARTGPVTPL